MHSEWSGVMLVNFESSEVYVNRKTCTGFPQIGGKLFASLCTRCSCNESEGWASLRHMGRPLIGLPVTFLQHLLWQKKAWDKTFLSWSTPFPDSPCWYQISCFLEKIETSETHLFLMLHQPPISISFQTNKEGEGEVFDRSSCEVWDIGLIAARRLNWQIAGCIDILYSSPFWEKQLT